MRAFIILCILFCLLISSCEKDCPTCPENEDIKLSGKWYHMENNYTITFFDNGRFKLYIWEGNYSFSQNDKVGMLEFDSGGTYDFNIENDILTIYGPSITGWNGKYMKN